MKNCHITSRLTFNDDIQSFRKEGNRVYFNCDVSINETDIVSRILYQVSEGISKCAESFDFNLSLAD